MFFFKNKKKEISGFSGKAAEEKANEIFEMAFEYAPDVIYVINAAGNFIHGNKGVEQLTGYKKEDLIGKNFAKTNLISPDQIPKGMAILAKNLLGKPTGPDNFIITRKNGSKVPVEIRTNPVTVGGKKFAIGAVRDITERLKLEKLNQEKENKYQQIFESVNDEIVYVDKLGRVIDVNGGAKDIFGYEPKDVIGKSFFELNVFDVKNLPQIAKIFKQVIAGGKGMDFMELEVKHKDGHKFFVEVSTKLVKRGGKTEGFMMVIRDITDRKARDEQIKRDKAKDEALLAGIGEGVIAVNTDSRIIFVNQAALNMVGYSVKELGDRFLHEKIVIEDEMGNVLPPDKRPITLTLLSGQTTVGGVSQSYYYRRKDGTRFPVATIVTPVVLEKKIIGAIDVFRDITEEKEIDRMKTEFVSLASHQLKTPLTSIKWFSEMMVKEEVGTLTDKQKEYLNMIFQSTGQMIGLVGSLLNVSRLEAGRIKIEPKLIRLDDIIQNVIIKSGVLLAEKKCKLNFIKTEPPLPPILLDESLIGEVIYNLFTNAIRYAKPGNGIVSVRTEKRGEDCVIEVSDNGIGIPKTDQHRIFERFFRADNARKLEASGSGLGLYLIKLILESSGGKIWFESEEGKGSKFYVSIPLTGMKERKGEKTLAIDRIS